MSRAAFGVFIFVSCVAVAAGQKESVPQPYDLDEAYRVYEAMIPNEESYSFAKGTLVIQSHAGHGTRVIAEFPPREPLAKTNHSQQVMNDANCGRLDSDY